MIDVGTAAMFSHGQGAVNQVAAVPSLHSAFVALVAIFLWRRVRPWRCGRCCCSTRWRWA